MPRKKVYTDVMAVIERRIAAGDYMLKDLPGERRLADEVGVSYMTARKAVQALLGKKVLTRRSNGSLAVRPRIGSGAAVARVALLTPAYPSPHFIACRLAITQAAEKFKVQFRAVEYVHWHDPVMNEALDGSDAVLVIPSTEPIPERLLNEFASCDRKVVFFDGDGADRGIPSVRLFAEQHVVKVFEHLWALGHRRVDCLNTQGHNMEVDRRIAEWRDWLDGRCAVGSLWDFPTPPYGDPLRQGYDAMRQILDRSPDLPGAMVCTTQPAAVGAIRACHDAALLVGKDVSICTINNEPTGRYFCPSLTGLEMPDLKAILEQCFNWFSRPGQPWQGPLTLVPKQPHFFAGESTGKPMRQSGTAAKAARSGLTRAKRRTASCRRMPIPSRP
jgi:DNA-binding LacI/PurR family transcriptional regulator